MADSQTREERLEAIYAQAIELLAGAETSVEIRASAALLKATEEGLRAIRGEQEQGHGERQLSFLERFKNWALGREPEQQTFDYGTRSEAVEEVQDRMIAQAGMEYVPLREVPELSARERARQILAGEREEGQGQRAWYQPSEQAEAMQRYGALAERQLDHPLSQQEQEELRRVTQVLDEHKPSVVEQVQEAARRSPVVERTQSYERGVSFGR